MRSPHHLHGVFDVAPLAGFFRITLALASHGVLGRLGDRARAMPLEHLPRDGVDLGLRCHLALPVVLVGPGTSSARFPTTAEPEVSFQFPPRTIDDFPREAGIRQ